MIKQIIVIRKDLGMRRGKEIAQGSHASMAFLFDKLGFEKPMSSLSNEEIEWIKGSFTKVCLQVNSEEELLLLHNKALQEKLTSYLITDSGFTEFSGRPTVTAIAIGPHESEKIDKITSKLRLY